MNLLNIHERISCACKSTSVTRSKSYSGSGGKDETEQRLETDSILNERNEVENQRKEERYTENGGRGTRKSGGHWTAGAEL